MAKQKKARTNIELMVAMAKRMDYIDGGIVLRTFLMDRLDRAKEDIANGTLAEEYLASNRQMIIHPHLWVRALAEAWAVIRDQEASRDEIVREWLAWYDASEAKVKLVADDFDPDTAEPPAEDGYQVHELIDALNDASDMRLPVFVYNAAANELMDITGIDFTIDDRVDINAFPRDVSDPRPSRDRVVQLAHELSAQVYQRYGAQGVRDIADRADWVHYGYCSPCSTEVPHLDGTCLLCGSDAVGGGDAYDE